jgi:hypothetical protein
MLFERFEALAHINTAQHAIEYIAFVVQDHIWMCECP